MLIRKKIETLESLASAWNAAGFSYAVANGLQGYPETIGRDIDVAVAPNDIEAVLKSTIEFFEERGFVVLPYKLGWPYWVIAFRRDEDELTSVQVDLFDHLQWGFSWVVDGLNETDPNHYEGPFRVDSWATVGKRIMLNGLSGNYETFEKKEWYLETTQSERSALSHNFLRLSGSTHEELQEAITHRDGKSLKTQFEIFRKEVFRHSLCSSNKFILRMIAAWKKQYYFNLNPPLHTPFITVSGESEEQVQSFTTAFFARMEKLLPYVLKQRNLVESHSPTLRSTINHLRKLRRSSALLEVQVMSSLARDTYLDTGNGIRRFVKKKLLPEDLNFDAQSESPDHAFERFLDWLERDSFKRMTERQVEFESLK